jgi:hypothetical protein
MAPSARWRCFNLVLFTDCFQPGDLVLTKSEPVDILEWRGNRRRPEE